MSGLFPKMVRRTNMCFSHIKTPSHATQRCNKLHLSGFLKNQDGTLSHLTRVLAHSSYSKKWIHWAVMRIGTELALIGWIQVCVLWFLCVPCHMTVHARRFITGQQHSKCIMLWGGTLIRILDTSTCITAWALARAFLHGFWWGASVFRFSKIRIRVLVLDLRRQKKK